MMYCIINYNYYNMIIFQDKADKVIIRIFFLRRIINIAIYGIVVFI